MSKTQQFLAVFARSEVCLHVLLQCCCSAERMMHLLLVKHSHAAAEPCLAQLMCCAVSVLRAQLLHAHLE
jgi:hypothetical protein